MKTEKVKQLRSTHPKYCLALGLTSTGEQAATATMASCTFFGQVVPRWISKRKRTARSQNCRTSSCVSSPAVSGNEGEMVDVLLSTLVRRVSAVARASTRGVRRAPWCRDSESETDVLMAFALRRMANESSLSTWRCCGETCREMNRDTGRDEHRYSKRQEVSKETGA